MKWFIAGLMVWGSSSLIAFPFKTLFQEQPEVLEKTISKSFSHISPPSVMRFSSSFGRGDSEQLYNLYSALIQCCEKNDSPMLDTISDGFCELGKRYIESPAPHEDTKFVGFLVQFFLFLKWLQRHEQSLDVPTRSFLHIFEKIMNVVHSETCLSRSYPLSKTSTFILPSIIPLFSTLKEKKIDEVFHSSLLHFTSHETRFITGLEPFLISGALSVLQEIMKPFLSFALIAIAFYWFRHEVFSFFQKPLKKKLKQIKKNNRRNMRIINEFATNELEELIRKTKRLSDSFTYQAELVENVQEHQKKLELFVAEQLLKTQSLSGACTQLESLYADLEKIKEEQLS